MRIFILTEGSINKGFGHVTRCTSLYQAFDKKGIVPEFLVNGDETVNALLKGTNHKVFNWMKEQGRLSNLIKHAEIIIVDSYLADYGFYKKISGSVNVPVYIDDNKRINYPKGIVINGTICADELNYSKKEDITYLLGTKYVPLRKEFWDVPEKEIKENIEKAMITFGGDDAKNMTPKVLKVLNEKYPGLIKRVIIGKGFKNIKKIEILKDVKTELIYYPNAEKMKKVMLESDIVISAAGQTLYELARVGVPTIAIAVADNQINNVKGWQKTGFINYAGWWEDKDVSNNLILNLKLLHSTDLRKEKVSIGKRMIDGLGAARVVAECIKQYYDAHLVLRKAETKDIYDIYELSNSLDVRHNSFNPSRVEIENHKIWFRNKINDPNCIFLVAAINNKFAGQVRFDKDNDRAVISISLLHAHRGSGIGQRMAQKALQYLKTHDPAIRYVVAYVKEENINSQHFFESLNFLYKNNKIIDKQKALEYSLELKS